MHSHMRMTYAFLELGQVHIFCKRGTRLVQILVPKQIYDSIKCALAFRA